MAAAKPMTKAQIVAHLAEKNEMTKKQVTEFLDCMVALAYKEAKKGFTIPGLGKIVVMSRKARMGRNPATGEAIKIPAKKVLKFRIAKAAKDAILPAKKK
jgi:DNA-binding protein HU-beta